MKFLYRLAEQLRNKRVLKYLEKKKRHLEVGVGRGYLLLRSPARSRLAITGDAETLLPMLQMHYDVITLVAVVEHLDDAPSVINECLRLLSSDGQLIITAPTWLGDLFTPLVDWQAGLEHKRVVTLKYLRSIVPRRYKITRRFFEFGLNQIFIVEAK